MDTPKQLDLFELAQRAAAATTKQPAPMSGRKGLTPQEKLDLTSKSWRSSRGWRRART
jgi:hypothetical protein